MVNDFNFTLILPEIFIACAAMLLLLFGAYYKGSAVKATGYVLKAAVIVIMLAAYQLLSNSEHNTSFNGMFIQDSFSVFAKLLILFAAFCIALLTFEIARPRHVLNFEYPILMLLSVVGMMLMVSANDLISLYMALELQSLALYVLTAIKRDDVKSSEAGLKYFMLGALASGLLLYGSSLVYGFIGTTNFSAIAQFLEESQGVRNNGILFGMVLIMVGLCFKLSAVPFHMWAPDVYEGAPKTVTAFFATAPKVAALALLMRVLEGPFGMLRPDWTQILIVVSVGSMLVGSLGALRQQNIKRLMAYSSIGHIGFLLVGLAAGTRFGAEAALIYMALYVVMNIGGFVCIMLMKRNDFHVETINDLAGLAKSQPLYALAFAILLFSMAGIPPMAGFFGKFFVFKAALASGLYALSIIGVLCSVVGAYYYIRIIKVMYFDAVNEPLDKDMKPELRYLLLITALFNLIFFIYPDPLINASRKAVEIFVF